MEPEQAGRLEGRLVDAFAQWNLAGTQLNAIECRTRSCRLEVNYAGAAPDELQELELASAFAEAFGGPVQISSASDGESGNVLYATALNR